MGSSTSSPRTRSVPDKRKSHIELVCIFSDIHFDMEHKPLWKAAREWHAQYKPDRTIFSGDFVDFGMLSTKYQVQSKEPLHAISQLKRWITEANGISKESGKTIAITGNHEDRWSKYINGSTPWALDGALGLDLHSQALYHGLNKNIEWNEEDVDNPGVKVGQFWLRHGHKQIHGGPFAGSGHPAVRRLRESHGRSEMIGHHHRVMMANHTAYGETQTILTLPTMVGNMKYAGPDPNWQRGWTVVEVDDDFAWPNTILWNQGRAVYNRQVYTGK